MTTYFQALYDGQAGGEFVADTVGFTELTWAGGGRGQIVQDIPDGTNGKLAVALIAGPLPSDNDVLTQGAVTANALGDATTLLYPAYFRLDVDITQDTPTAGEIQIDWDAAGGAPVADGNGIIPTHSLFFDGQTVDLTVGQTLTFSGGQTAQLVNIIDQTLADGEIEIRMISNLDAGLPVDGDTFTDEGTGNGTVQGVVHPRSYTPLHLHRLLADLNDDAQFSGDDVLSSIDPTPSRKDTDQIVRLVGGAHVTDTLVDHMFGGSVAQLAGPSGDVKYSGLDVQVTSPLATTRPVLIQYDIATGLDAIVTDKWSNAWNPDSIAGNVRVMRKVRENGVDIDGRRIRGFLGELAYSYFTGSTTLGDATTSLALFASPDGNNATAEATLNTSPYTTVVLTEGFQQLDYNNGNGATDFLLELDYGSATSLQAYERTKYLQRRGSTSNIFGRNGQLVIGANRNFAWDGSTDTLLENTLMAWGTKVPFDTQTAAFSQGESVTFSGGAKGRILLLEDAGVNVGTMIVEVTSGAAIADGETITGLTSGGDALVNDLGVVVNSRSGIGWLLAWDDAGTTGNIYYQGLAGLDPVDNQPVYQDSAGTIVSATVNGTVATRTINNQFIGVYTGTNFQTNFGIGVQPADAVLGDLNRNLADVQQGVPNNQSGVITNLLENDRVWCYDWDGSTVDANGDAVPNWSQLANNALLNGAAVTSIVVSTAIPSDTPSSGKLRVLNDSGIRVLIPYSSWSGSTFTIPAYDFSGTGVNASVSATNDVTIAYIDETVGAAITQASFTAIYNADRQMATRVLRGSNSPIVPSPGTPTFSSTGFNIAANRLDDS